METNNITRKNSPRKLIRRERRIKNLRVFGRTLRSTYPYVLTAGAIVGLACAIGYVPIKLDMKDKQVYLETEIPTPYEDKVIERRVIEDAFNHVQITGIWYKEGDFYYRNIIKCPIGDYTKEQIIKTLQEQKTEIYNEGSEKVRFTRETKERLTEEELVNNVSKLSIHLYNKIENEFVKVEETTSEDLTADIVTAVFMIVGMLGLFWLRYECDLCCLREDLRDMIQNYKDKKEYIKKNH